MLHPWTNHSLPCAQDLRREAQVSISDKGCAGVVWCVSVSLGRCPQDFQTSKEGQMFHHTSAIPYNKHGKWESKEKDHMLSHIVDRIKSWVGVGATIVL